MGGCYYGSLDEEVFSKLEGSSLGETLGVEYKIEGVLLIADQMGRLMEILRVHHWESHLVHNTEMR